MQLSRREFVAATASAGLSLACGNQSALAEARRGPGGTDTTPAGPAGSRPLRPVQTAVFVLLRGGLDGLSLIAPYGDPDYRRVRPSLALGRPDDPVALAAGWACLDLDGFFGLHPAAAALQPLFATGLAVARHGVGLSPEGYAIAHRGPLRHPRRHRDMQYRLRERIARIGKPTSACTPADFGNPDFADLIRYSQERRLDPLPGEMDPIGPAPDLDAQLRGAMDRITARSRPRTVVLADGGWDTHGQQALPGNPAGGYFAGKVGQLAGSLRRFCDRLQAARMWESTVVLVVSEFGRSVRENARGGTDHGSAGVVLAMGGPVAHRPDRRPVLGDWPGLASDRLHEGRDLCITTATEDVLAEAVAGPLRAGVDLVG